MHLFRTANSRELRARACLVYGDGLGRERSIYIDICINSSRVGTDRSSTETSAQMRSLES